MTREVTVGDHQEKDSMELIDDMLAYGSTNKTDIISNHSCPNCGYCPHCGRGGYHNWWPIFPGRWNFPMSY